MLTSAGRAILGLCTLASLGPAVASLHPNPARPVAFARPEPAARPTSRPTDPRIMSSPTMASAPSTWRSSTSQSAWTRRLLAGPMDAVTETSLDPSPLPLAQSLGTYFTADPAVWHAPLTIQMGARYVAGNGFISIPIFLLAPTQTRDNFGDWTDPNSLVSLIQSEVTGWLASTLASTTDASVVFTVEVKSAGGQTIHSVRLRYGLG
jgi:hypothetical protein